MKLLLMFLLLNSTSLFAVKVKDCPSRIKVTVADIKLTPVDKLDLTELSLSDEEEAALKKDLENLEGMDKVSETLGLATKENSECKYGGYQLYGWAVNPRAKFFTKNGDWLRLAFQTDRREYGFYINVYSYNPKEIVVDNEKGIQLLLSYDKNHGEFSGTLPVGKASKISVEVLD